MGASKICLWHFREFCKKKKNKIKNQYPVFLGWHWLDRDADASLSHDQEADIGVGDVGVIDIAVGESDSSDENWETRRRTKKELRGKYADYTISELRRLYKKLAQKPNKTAEELSELRRIMFAIRAKTGWGPVLPKRGRKLQKKQIKEEEAAIDSDGENTPKENEKLLNDFLNSFFVMLKSKNILEIPIDQLYEAVEAEFPYLFDFSRKEDRKFLIDIIVRHNLVDRFQNDIIYLKGAPKPEPKVNKKSSDEAVEKLAKRKAAKDIFKRR